MKRYISVTLFTGMRQGEVLGITWDCIDFERGTILIEKQLQKNKEANTYGLVSIKNDKARKITPAPSVMQRLKGQRARQAGAQLLSRGAWHNPDGLVFTNEQGRHLVSYTVYKNLKRIVRELGLDDMRFHDLRHSYAVNALQSGDDLKSVQEALGHHAAAFTLDVYGHVSDTMKKQSAERMERFIQGIKPCKG